MKPRRMLADDRLDACRVIHMRHRRQVAAHSSEFVQASRRSRNLRLRTPVGTDRGDKEHVGTRLPQLEKVPLPSLQNRRGEGPERLPELDGKVHPSLHLRSPRITQQGSLAESPRAELRAPGKMADNLSRSNLRGNRLRQLLLGSAGLINRMHAVQGRLHLDHGERRSEAGAELGIRAPRNPRPVQMLEPVVKRRTQRTSGITGRRLDPQFVKRAFTQKAPVGDTIQGDSSGETKLLQARLPMDMDGQPQHHILGHLLDARRKIHVPLSDGIVRTAGVALKKPVETPVRHGQSRTVVEIPLVQPERSVVQDLDEMPADQTRVAWLPVGRHPMSCIPRLTRKPQ